MGSVSADARGIVDVVLGRYGDGKGDEALYVQAYSNEPGTFDRKCGVVRLKRMCLSICWLMQPDVWKKMCQGAFSDSGRLARFCFCDTNAVAPPIPEKPSQISESVLKDYANLLDGFVIHSRDNREHVILDREPGVWTLMRDFDNETRESRNPGGAHAHMRGIAARWAENAWKLSLCLHMAEHGAAKGPAMEVGVESARRAIRIVEWFSRQQQVQIAKGEADKMEREKWRLEDVLRDCAGHVSFRDLVKNHTMTRKRVEKIVAAFPDKFEPVTRQNPNGGPPSRGVKIKLPPPARLP